MGKEKRCIVMSKGGIYYRCYYYKHSNDMEREGCAGGCEAII
jgi:hypothetical protein